MNDLVIDILDLFYNGLTSDEIAAELGIPWHWVDTTLADKGL